MKGNKHKYHDDAQEAESSNDQIKGQTKQESTTQLQDAVSESVDPTKVLNEETEIGLESAEDLAKEVGQLQDQVLQLKDRLLRNQAEMENVRRRSQEEVSKARKFSIESFAKDLLLVKDSLEAALVQESQTVDAFAEGVETTLRQLISIFERNNLKEISPAPGDAFDPHYHQAIASQPNSEIAANNVLQMLQKGYVISGRVLRPAMVIVSAG